METAPAVEMRRITKSFPCVLANDGIDFTAAFGEVHALVGENGAGKSTLMSILYGTHHPDSGEICLSGQAVEIRSPRDAVGHGIGMVHQHFMLVPAFTALENIFLGAEPAKLGRTDYRAANERASRICERFGLGVDLGAKVADLSVSAQQKTEILKALYREVRILILDEPTSVLTPQESDSLFAMLRGMAENGMCIVLITHKLAEVIEHSDRVTVLRQGCRIASLETSRTTADELACLMVGERESVEAPRSQTCGEPPLLSVSNLTVIGERRLTAVDGVSFEVRAGEILGVAGVDGNGQRELAEGLMGIRRSVGGMRLGGMDLTWASVRKRLDAGIAYIPEDRGRDALVGGYSIEENAILGAHRRRPVARWGMLDLSAARDRSLDLIRRFGIKASGPEMPAAFLSGGNQQKLVLGRVFSGQPKLLVACQPTRGLDIGASRDIHSRLMEARSQGMGILLISYDLDEVLSLSDRVMVMFQGRVVGIADRADADRETIGAMMLGASR
jgi:simple sugar transport system ATP-binding protein